MCSKWKTTNCAGAQVKLVWIQWQLSVDMGDVTTCKFVGDASLNKDSFIHCVIYWSLQISIIGQICSFLWTRKNKKAFSFRGPWPPPGLCPLNPRWGLRPQTPIIGSHSALAMEFELCAVLNWSLRKPWYSDKPYAYLSVAFECPLDADGPEVRIYGLL